MRHSLALCNPAMELRHLRYFVAVAEAFNFRRATTRLPVGPAHLESADRGLPFLTLCVGPQGKEDPLWITDSEGGCFFDPDLSLGDMGITAIDFDRFPAELQERIRAFGFTGEQIGDWANGEFLMTKRLTGQPRSPGDWGEDPDDL
jgi:hypothetical protein